ncbi:hypothetical protein MKX08_005355 [Trichoderma sp. CBMAI-0020]|nr:hypothetical protein MKX08_005355 [Trichoderma sp. CBMAI-0020]WOD45743.1 hypothetical protein [Trichoderma atroviride]
MSSKKVKPNPVFQALAEIQRGTDDMTECPNTQSFHEKMKTFVTYTHCKGKHRNKALDAFDVWKKKKAIDELTPEWGSTPSTSLIETTISPITAAALQLLPSTPAQSIVPSDYATSDDGTSFAESIADTHSVTSNTTCMTSLPNTPLRNGTVSRFHVEDVAEEECASEPGFEEDIYVDSDSDEEAIQEDTEQDVFEDTITKEESIRDRIINSGIKQVCDDGEERIRDSVSTMGINTPLSKSKHNDERKVKEEKRGDNEAEDSAIEGLGIIGIQRTLSLRDHSPVFQVINAHPTRKKMEEGVVYILEHEKNPSLFKIGWSSKSAKERQRQPGNCYGINTKIFYETKRFVGAPQAERIAQVILRHVNIRVSECFYCQGGHREWFAAPRETVHETVMHVEEFLQLPAYTLQDEVYKLSPEVYERVVKQMCDFSVARFGELMHGPRGKREEAEISDVLIDTKVLPLAQLPLEPVEMSRLNAGHGFSESQEDSKSLISTSSHDTKSQNLSAGVKLMRKVKWLFSISDSVRAYFSDL